MACPGHEPHDAVIAHALRHMASGGGVPLAIGALPEPCGSLYPSRPTNMGLATTPTAMTSSEAGATPASCARSLARASPDADLPWHFSWIDSDSAIGGSSAPTERRHWRALRDANVGLVVNLTESPVSPPRPPHSRARDCVSTVNPLASADMDGLLFGTAWDDISTSSTSPAADVDKLEYGGICAKCGHVDDVYDSDLFADVALPPHSLSPHSPVSQASDADDSDSSSTTVTDVTSGMAVLFLPIPDGSVPRFEQLDIFLKEANTTIRAGKKVIVHCQAGVGRTGTFLAAYLINKYNFDPLTAITVLRRYRPQSLQFHSTDWQVDPFRLHPDPKAYNRNMVQERFVERWWHLVVRERSGRRTSISRPPSSPVPDGQHHHHHPQEESGVVGEYSSSHHKNRRRATLIMDASKLISEDGEGSAGHHGAVSLGAGSKPAGKHRRRHTDSGAATYDGFVEYLIALSKQQHQSKQQQQHQQHSAHQHQQSHEPQLHLGSLPPLSEHPDASMIEGVKHVKANINTSMLSSSLSAISAYPTPPRTSEISTGFLGAAPAAEIPQVQVHVPNTPPTSVTLGPHTLSSSNLTAGIGAAVASAGADGSVGLPLLSSSLNDSISKLSTSIPMGPHPYSRTSIGSTGSYQRKRHPKPMLHAHSHQPSSIMVPKSSSFTISSILLKLIDQQLDGKFSGFTAPCVVSREHADRAAYSVGVPVGRVVHASGGGLPATRETSASLCYGCRGVVAVGPEKVQVVVPAVGVCDSPALALQQPGVAVWPALVPFPKQGDELLAGATTGLSGVMLSGMNVSPASPRSPLSPSGGAAVDGLLLMSGSVAESFAAQQKVHGWGNRQGRDGDVGVFGEDMDLDMDLGPAPGNTTTPLPSSSFVVGSVSSDLNGAVEALKLEEVQRKEISLAVRNRVV